MQIKSLVIKDNGLNQRDNLKWNFWSDFKRALNFFSARFLTLPHFLSVVLFQNSFCKQTLDSKPFKYTDTESYEQ